MLITVAAGPVCLTAFTLGSVNHTFSYKFTHYQTFLYSKSYEFNITSTTVNTTATASINALLVFIVLSP